MNQNIQRVLFLCCTMLATGWMSCTKEEENKVLTTPTGLSISFVEMDTVDLQATLGGTVTGDGGSVILAKGICFSKRNISPTIEDEMVLASGRDLGPFSVQLTNLENTTYYFARAFATNALGTSYSNVKEFNSRSFPILTTTFVSRVSVDSAFAGGVVTDSGGRPISARGVVFSTSPEPTLVNGASIVNPKLARSTFTVSLKNLVEGATYYYRAYAISSLGSFYGPEWSFKTQKKQSPLIFTTPLTQISFFSVSSGGTIINALSTVKDTILRRGILYSKEEPVVATKIDTVFDSYVFPPTPPIRFPSNYALSITGLEPNTKYFVWAFAITKNGKAIGLGQVFSFTTMRTEISFHGDVYKTTLIGTQLWMRENLKTTKYRDGSDITIANDATSWKSANGLKQGATTFYNETDAEYGRLYNHFAVVDARQLCPAGWHIPTDLDWTTFYSSVGGVSAFLKDSTGWPSRGINSSLFSAKPNGRRNADGTFVEKGLKAFYWGAAASGLKGDAIEIADNEAFIKRNYYNKNSGHSVRCLKD